MGLYQGIINATFEELEKQNPLTQITVRPEIKKGIVSLLGQSFQNELTEDSLKEISKISNIKTIFPSTRFNNFASLEIELLGIEFITDTMAFGVPLGFIINDLPNPEIWEKDTEPYPALVPRKILELYNLTVANPQNLPTFSEEMLINKIITFYPNYSTFFPFSNKMEDKIQLQIIGFSDKINLIGITLPTKIIEKFNNLYTETQNNNYLEFFVETTDSALTKQVASNIKKLGYETHYLEKNIDDIEAKFLYLQIALASISIIIIITAGIAIMSNFLSTITERTQEIGILRAVGANKNHIKKLVLLEAGIIGILGSILGIFIGCLSGLIINKISLQELATIALIPNNLFLITFQTIIIVFLFGVLLSTISAYIPAIKASKITPLDAVNKI